jgi:DNA polymerase-3 subunit chi
MEGSSIAKPLVAFHFNAPDKLDYACRFIRKAMRHDVRVTVVAPMARLRQLSAKLWKQSAHDFLAHAVVGDDLQSLALAPVALVEEAEQSPHRELLLHLGTQVQHGFEAFDKVVEVVASFDEEDRALARVRWRTYQTGGYAIERYDLVLKER